MTVVAGVDIGNATTEVACWTAERLLGADRLPTRGRKGSADSLRGAAALVRRIERRLGTTVAEARIAPLRAVDTTTLTIPAAARTPAGCACWPPGSPRPAAPATCVGAPVLAGRGSGWRDRLTPARTRRGSPWCPPASATRRRRGGSASCSRPGSRSGRCWPAVTRACSSPTGSAPRSRSSTRSTWPRRPPARRLAVEVRRPGQPMTLLTDPVALAAALRLGDAEAGDAATVSRALLDYGNGVIGLAAGTAPGPGPAVRGWPPRVRPSRGWWRTAAGSACGLPAPSWRAGRSAPSPRSAPRMARPPWTTCSRWTWPPRRTASPPGGAAWAGPRWSRRCTGSPPATTTPPCSLTCSAAR